ncbi:hypothetical protein B9Z19DRAFT_1148261 [Tuber borchii]|uniref:Uncharacterized protein n=1 Tax=Tuber borchii TaxID=42251 RepID=A0A2T6ZMT7_TUBBO|nr:hypothetical protein B9Z19DRAFT_1148261 [Tuber borchii]
MWTYVLSALLLLQSIAVQAQSPSLTKTPLSRRGSSRRHFDLPLVEFLGFKEDGCQPAPDFHTNIFHPVVCTPITNATTGITNVIVVANDKLPSTCILTLYADSNCKDTSSAEIGPIFPTSKPSACIGPIRDSGGDLFQANAAQLNC